MQPPELSIIVPLLDEASTLPELFRTLGRQQDVTFELILCDGGSTDGTLALAQTLADQNPFSCRILHCNRGRGRQMNAGATIAQGQTFLFLHADSQFFSPSALLDALAALKAKLHERGDERVAGRFSLNFRRASAHSSRAYYFYECKARLDRPGCIHGDQGILLPSSFFFLLGSFDDSLQIFEDDRLADKVRLTGEWLLLPAEIFTAARRFETEGLPQRQTLNAILMNFAAIGREDFFRQASGLYRQQSRAARLELYPFFAAIDECVRKLPWRHRLQLWYRTGAFVRDNAWQLAFACDTRRNFRSGFPAGQGPTPALAFYDRRLNALTDHPIGRFLAAGLTWCWFHASRILMRR